jgi:hypothetical protein
MPLIAGLEARIGQLNIEGKLIGPSGWPTGSKLVADLRSFLAIHRYATA